MELRKIAERIARAAIVDAKPDEAVKRALRGKSFTGNIQLIAIGKAAWQMANTAYSVLRERIKSGAVITKYGHSQGKIGGLRIFEAGHPVPDENTLAATAAAVDMVSCLTEKDTVLFLVSGGGSALFEKPLLPLEELADITRQLLAAGASIVEINSVRKRLSAVKGGRFAEICAPAHVFCIVLSDIVDDPLDMIASGPACPDASTCGDAARVVKKYGLRLSPSALELLGRETPKRLDNVETLVTGSVRQLCASAERECAALGFKVCMLTASLNCHAREAGAFFASIARCHKDSDRPLAFIAGGETVVLLKGHGLGGRNQEMALSAARGLDGIVNAAFFSVGSDGTDGPTDAAGGYADGQTAETLRRLGIDLEAELDDNNSYRALKACGGLIVTGPTGTNVNDLSVLLIEPLSGGAAINA